MFTTAGLPDPDPPLPPTPPFVAIAVGKTKDGESLPAKPARRQTDNLRGLSGVKTAHPTLRTLYRCGMLAEKAFDSVPTS